MYESNIRIKKSSGAFMLKGIFYLIMFLASMYCALFSKLHYVSNDYMPYVFGAGITGCLYFSFLFVHTVTKSFLPSDALVITNNGIFDFLTYPSKGLFVDWDNISTIRIFGSKKSPLLGIELFDTEIFLSSVKKSVADEIRANIEAGLPAVVIKQSDLAENLSLIVPELNEYLTKTRPVNKISKANQKNAPSEEKRSLKEADTYERFIEKLPEDEDNKTSKISEKEIEIPLFSQEMRYDDLDETETVKSVKSARKDMEEIFMLPVDDLSDNEKKFFNLTEKEKSPSFDFDPLETKKSKIDKNSGTQIFNAVKENTQKNGKTVSQTEPMHKNRDNGKNKSEKKEDEIKSLESLLSMFSIPITESNQEEDSEINGNSK